MNHDEIVKKVKDILNEHGGSDALSITEDRVLLEDYIETAIPDAVIMLAQKGYRVNVVEFVTSETEDAFGHKYIDLNTTKFDFISLISAKVDGWKREVTKLTEVGSPEYAMAQNEFTKPNIHNPMVVLRGNMLLLYPLDFGDEWNENSQIILTYNRLYDKTEGLCYKRTHIDWPEQKIENSFAEDGETKEATAVCYMTAALVLGMFGDDTGKQRLSDICTNMLQ